MACFSSVFASVLVLIVSTKVSLGRALPTSIGANSKRAPGDCLYHVDGVGSFTKSVSYTFPVDGPNLPAGLRKSDGVTVADTESGAPYNHIFLGGNVVIKNKYLEIKVPGAQNPSSRADQAITAGEVFTDDSDILYASVRTHAIFSTVPGTCQGTFFYKHDTQEIDTEYLSDPNSEANIDGKAGIHLTNQPTNGGQSTTGAFAPPSNLGSVLHEYRIDWTKDYTAFYLDGVLQTKYTDNIPSTPGTWLWNNWANGDMKWTAGPPATDSVMKVSKIEMFYNTTSSTATACTA